ncbi:hypothetical protein HYH03_005372 [Edaphochlamys debaryana]|uniref:Uncharacterized protein n=1 Tax=Edaphochlamys debaryana TaxID=47281 RepID=A0A835YFA6_9CHLO|nr:hypothetical protein HYH03_005372 [Edaphochlamys debaryana]|eukprot:KAG2496549.1 hypothetical protein HYH03_005372 [Edaphochlamys debaryana]
MSLGVKDAVGGPCDVSAPAMVATTSARRVSSSSGCDSSDCLFCQYRSHNVNAYAGKLTTLLRKRSLPLASLNSLFDEGTEHGAALLAATAAVMCNGNGTSKRHKVSTTGMMLQSIAISSPVLGAATGAGAGPLHVIVDATAAGASPRPEPRQAAPAVAQPSCSGRTDGLPTASAVPTPRRLPSPAAIKEGLVDAGPFIARQSQLAEASSSHHRRITEAARLLSSESGWRFQPEWRARDDPAPASLREVLRLPGSGRGGGGSASSSGRGVGMAGIVGALEFSPDGRLLAAGGVDKQVRLYNLTDVFDDASEWEDDGEDGEDDSDDDLLLLRRARTSNSSPSVLAAVHRLPSKISSLAWCPFMDGMVTVGDYDGVLLQLHVASGHQLADVDAHAGRKIWSVAHSSAVPHLAASAADDRVARLWQGRGLETCVAELQPNPRASVCSVDLSPGEGNLLALACSDRVSYVYDMRRLGGGPMAALRHHSRPASYCRFLSSDRLVTAATDASLALWDLRAALPELAGVMAAPVVAELGTSRFAREASPFSSVQEPAWSFGAAPAPGVGTGLAAPSAAAAEAAAPARVFRGHRNEKNFVGLSVRAPDGLVACGSECSRAFAYHTSWADPLATLDLLGCGSPRQQAQQPSSPWPSCAAKRCSGMGAADGGDCSFVSAVCWQPAAAAAALELPPILAAATSWGDLSLSVLQARA